MSCNKNDFCDLNEVIDNQICLLNQYKYNKEDYKFNAIIKTFQFHVVVNNEKEKTRLINQYLNCHKNNYKYKDVKDFISILATILNYNVLVDSNLLTTNQWKVLNGKIIRREYLMSKYDNDTYDLEFKNEYIYNTYEDIK